MIEDFSPPDSPDVQNTNDPQQTDPNILNHWNIWLLTQYTGFP